MDQIVNVAAALDIAAARQPHRQAIVFPQGRDKSGRVSYTHLTFAQLVAESDCIARGLVGAGIDKGCRAVLMVSPSLDFFALTFALFRAGIIPVLIDPGIGLKNLKDCIRQAEPQAFIGMAKAHVARKVLRWGRKTIRKCVTVGARWFWGGSTLEEVKALGKADRSCREPQTRPDDTAAILFTSGSTGAPKGVVYRHSHFVAQLESIRRTYRIEPGEIDLPTFPLFALFDPALGMTTVVPDMDPTRPAAVDPAKIVEAIDNFGVTNMFGSPALLNRVGRYGIRHGVKLPTLRRVISAGAPVSAAVVERFARMLPAGAQIFTPYGATESLPVCSIGSDEILGETRAQTDRGKGICVGRPVEGMEVAVIKISDEAIERWDDSLKLKAGEIGEIVVAGPTVTSGYYGLPQATRLAKICETGGLRHRMGDVGYLDQDGRLWYCGRKAHRVEIHGKTMYTIPCEAIFNTHPAVYRSALVGAVVEAKTLPVLCVELEPGHRGELAKIEAELLDLASRHEITRAVRHVLFHPAFPVDIRHNAKIFREKLALWAQRRLA